MDTVQCAKGAEFVVAAALPEPCRGLLDHEAHMTEALRKHHGGPVELHVLAHYQQSDSYRRLITLTMAGSGHVVELGAVHLQLDRVPLEVRAEILEQRSPLGDVLIRHNVLRRVEPKWFVRFQAPNPVLSYLKAPEAYGRIGLIHCNGRPAIELLEVVPSESTIVE
jgi:chorismate-pyruvate lyase